MLGSPSSFHAATLHLPGAWALPQGVTRQITQKRTVLVFNVLFNFQGTWDSDKPDA